VVTRKVVRAGIVGAGWMGQVHARSWVRNSPRGVIAAVTDVSEPRARALSDEHAGGQARIHADLDALLADREVDAVDICLPHHLHADAIVRAARAGKHVFCEKPLCLSFDEARTIKRALDESGVTLVAAHNNLFSLPLIEARKLLADGVLGKTYYAESFEIGRNTGFIAGKAPVPLAEGESSIAWRRDPKRMGGAELLDTGWHGMYRLLSLVDSRPVEVVAMAANHHIKTLPGEDTAHVLLNFASGVQGSMLTSWAFGGEPGAWQFRVHGEHGSIAGSVTKLVLAPTNWPAAPAERNWDTTHGETYVREVTHFLDVLLDGTESQASWSHAARTLQCIQAGYLSLREKRVVPLPDDPTEL